MLFWWTLLVISIILLLCWCSKTRLLGVIVVGEQKLWDFDNTGGVLAVDVAVVTAAFWLLLLLLLEPTSMRIFEFEVSFGWGGGVMSFSQLAPFVGATAGSCWMSQCCCCFVLLWVVAVAMLVGGGGKLLLAGEFSHSSAGSRLPPSHSACGGITGPYKKYGEYFCCDLRFIK